MNTRRRPDTDVQSSDLAVCLEAMHRPGQPSSSRAGYTLRINNRRRSREQTPSIHPSIHASMQRTSHALQSDRQRSQSVQTPQSASTRRLRAASAAEHTWSTGRCNQSATAGQFVIAPAGRISELIHSKCIDRRGKGRQGVRQMTN